MTFADYTAAVAKQLCRNVLSLTAWEIGKLSTLWQSGGHDIVSLGVKALSR